MIVMASRLGISINVKYSLRLRLNLSTANKFTGLENGKIIEAVFATKAQANTYGKGFSPYRLTSMKTTGVRSRAVASFDINIVMIIPRAKTKPNKRQELPLESFKARLAAELKKPDNSAK
ncbi:hypothetical protein UCH007_07400 [Dehalococcoides sp. UCH007]|nr:hypothetical protein UCH007_07400 [Dehalococcoides sp. UCH007]